MASEPTSQLRDFEHDVLSIDRPTIRLFQLNFATKEGRISGQLKHVEIGKNTYGKDGFKYVCLSYAWGPDTPTHEIQINNRPFKIRHNLWLFFQQAKKRKIDDWLWIDAICIDQSNPVERGHQVRLMGEIYSKAKHVLVYPGEVQRRMDLLALIIWILEIQPTTLRSALKRAPKLLRSGVRPFIQRFAEALYWSRMWIVQEVLLADTVYLMLPKTMLDARSLRFLARSSAETPSPMEHIIALQSMSNAARRVDDPWMPWMLLKSTAHSKCEMANDRIYALLGLMHKDISEKIPIDYTRNWHLVVMDLLESTEEASRSFAGGKQRPLTTWYVDLLDALRFYPAILCRRCAQAEETIREPPSSEMLKTVLKSTNEDWSFVWIVDEPGFKIPLDLQNQQDEFRVSQKMNSKPNEKASALVATYRWYTRCQICSASVLAYNSKERLAFSRPIESVMFVKVQRTD